jgi:hypothetical protein
MDQPYSAFADLLSKFHTAAIEIRALWLFIVLMLGLGMTWLVMRGLRDVAVAMRRERRPRQEATGLLLYGVVQDRDGNWHVVRLGCEPQPVDLKNPPPELLGRTGELT